MGIAAQAKAKLIDALIRLADGQSRVSSHVIMIDGTGIRCRWGKKKVISRLDPDTRTLK